MASLIIGSGTVVSGTFASINWANGPYFIKIETDPTGGTNYTISGSSQLMSVPYALFSANISQGNANIVPRIADMGQKLSVSFSGGENLTFSQASPSCPLSYADVILTFNQGSPTTIYPTNTYYIDSKRFDAVFEIPYDVPSGLYNIVISPTTQCPYTFPNSFKINY